MTDFDNMMSMIGQMVWNYMEMCNMTDEEAYQELKDAVFEYDKVLVERADLDTLIMYAEFAVQESTSTKDQKIVDRIKNKYEVEK